METNFRKTVGKVADRIRSERKSLGLSQEELATVSGISFRTFKRLEAGQCDSFEAILRIAYVFEQQTNRTRLSYLDEMFPGAPQSSSNKTPLGALHKLLATRDVVNQRERRKK